MVYIVRSRAARTTQKNPVSKPPQEERKTYIMPNPIYKCTECMGKCGFYYTYIHIYIYINIYIYVYIHAIRNMHS